MGLFLSLLYSLVGAMSAFMALFYVLSRARILEAGPEGPRGPTLVLYWIFFAGITITGSYLGIQLPDGVIANTRAVGAMVSGFVGGPWLGLAVGATAGAHRLWLGGTTAVAGALATVMEGVVGGLVRWWLERTEGAGRLPGWRLGAGVTIATELVHMGFVVLFSPANPDPLRVAEVIGPPMIMANAMGVALFALVMRDRQRDREQVQADSSARALRTARRTLGLLARGYDAARLPEVARIIKEETGAGAVCLTDASQVLAFEGLGADHHRAPGPIVSHYTRRAIETGEVVFADGRTEHYNCPISRDCPLDSVLIAPLSLDGVVIGTVQVFEPCCRPRSTRVRRAAAPPLQLGEPVAGRRPRLAALGAAAGGALPGGEGAPHRAGAQAGASAGQPALPLQRPQHGGGGAAGGPGASARAAAPPRGLLPEKPEAASPTGSPWRRRWTRRCSTSSCQPSPCSRWWRTPSSTASRAPWARGRLASACGAARVRY